MSYFKCEQDIYSHTGDIIFSKGKSYKKVPPYHVFRLVDNFETVRDVSALDYCFSCK